MDQIQPFICFINKILSGNSHALFFFHVLAMAAFCPIMVELYLCHRDHMPTSLNYLAFSEKVCLPPDLASIFIFSILQSSSVGEGNGTPLQYSCLENPMVGGAW